MKTEHTTATSQTSNAAPPPDEEEPNLPSISDPSDLDLTPEDIVRIISVNIRFYEGWDE